MHNTSPLQIDRFEFERRVLKYVEDKQIYGSVGAIVAVEILKIADEMVNEAEAYEAAYHERGLETQESNDE